MRMRAFIYDDLTGRIQTELDPVDVGGINPAVDSIRFIKRVPAHVSARPNKPVPLEEISIEVRIITCADREAPGRTFRALGFLTKSERDSIWG